MIECCQCGATFDGTRSEARRLRGPDGYWEPYSHRSQWHVDHGPMVCGKCVRGALDALHDALRKAYGR